MKTRQAFHPEHIFSALWNRMTDDHQHYWNIGMHFYFICFSNKWCMYIIFVSVFWNFLKTHHVNRHDLRQNNYIHFSNSVLFLLPFGFLAFSHVLAVHFESVKLAWLLLLCTFKNEYLDNVACVLILELDSVIRRKSYYDIRKHTPRK